MGGQLDRLPAPPSAAQLVQRKGTLGGTSMAFAPRFLGVRASQASRQSPTCGVGIRRKGVTSSYCHVACKFNGK
jgi:hypothetical protein